MAWRLEGPPSMVVTNASTVQLLQHPREARLAQEEAALMDPVWRRKVAVLLAIAVTLAAILHRPLAYCSFRAQTQAGASPQHTRQIYPGRGRGSPKTGAKESTSVPLAGKSHAGTRSRHRCETGGNAGGLIE